MVRVWTIFTIVCLLLVVFILIGNMIRATVRANDHRAERRAYKKYYNKIREAVLTVRTLELSEIIDILDLPKNFKMKKKQNQHYIPVLLKIHSELDCEMNDVNWQRTLQVLQMPAYFENQVRSRRNRDKVMAFKNVSDLDANLKEAVASRYLYTRNPKLKISARLHAAHFGTSYPFKVLEEDPNLVFTQELMVKYHNALDYRYRNNLSMPNFIQWCHREPVNNELRIFAVNEIRLFKQEEDCPELLAMYKDSRDEEFSCALVQALGELRYAPSEPVFLEKYLGASFVERQTLAEALGFIGSGNPQVLDFLVEDFKATTDYVSRLKLLRIIYEYGDKGREAFEHLKITTPAKYAIYFQHIECDYIDSRRYA